MDRANILVNSGIFIEQTARKGGERYGNDGNGIPCASLVGMAWSLIGEWKVA